MSRVRLYKGIANIIVWSCSFFVVYWLTDLLLQFSFSHNGEGYYKGAGHIFQESIWKSVLFLFLRNVLLSIIVFYLIFWPLKKEARNLAFKISLIVWCIGVGLTGAFLWYKVAESMEMEVNVNYKSLEIFLMVFFRALGFYLGYLLAIRKFELNRYLTW